MKKLVRRFVGLAIVLALVVGVAVLAVQVVLWDGRVPRGLVEDGLTEQTGLRTEVKRVRTGWFGESVLEDVTLWLPLEDEPLATVPRLRVGHSELLALVLGWPLSIRTAELDKPVIHVREGADGAWNVERALALLELAQGGREEGPRGRLRLPDLDIPSATLEIRRASGRGMTIPLAVAAETDAAGGWAFAVDALGRGRVKGRVAPGGDWLHDAEFEVEDIGEVIELWLDDAPSPVRAAGVWRGRAVSGGISGTARIEEILIGEERASGVVRIETGDESGAGVARARPDGLEVSSPRLPGGPVVVRGGEVLLGENTVGVAGVVAEWMGNSAVVDGSWDGAGRAGELTAAWSGVIEGLGVTQQGSVRVEAALPRAGAKRVDVELSTRGRGLGGEWESEVLATVSGVDLARVEAGVHARTVRWTDSNGTVDVGGVRAGFAGEWPVVRLTSLEVPGAEVRSAAGEVDAQTLVWSVVVDVAEWDVPRLGAGALEVVARASGEGERVEVEKLRVVAAGVEVEGSGRYSPGGTVPLDVVWTATVPAGVRGAPRDLGSWRVEGRASGGISPLEVRAEGSAVGEGARGPAEALAPVEVMWRGEVRDGEEGEGVVGWVRTDAFALLDGMCVVRARYGGEDEVGSLNISVTEVPLGSVARVVGAPVELGGALTADVEVAAPEWDLSRLSVEGSWSVERPIADTYGVDRGRGKIRTREGRVDFTDIVMELGEGRVSGSVGFNLSEMHKLELVLASRGWPVGIKGTAVGVLLDAGVELSIDVAERRASGTVNVSSPILVDGARYGEFALGAVVDGRTITAERVVAEVGGGRLSGTAHVPIDELLATRVDVAWERMGLAELARPWMDVEGMSGALAGSLKVGPSEDRRAPEPLRIDLTLSPRDGVWRGGELGDAVFTAFAGPDRVMLDASSISLAGGTVEVWSRASRHGDEPFVHVDATLNGLDLEVLLPMVDPGLAPSPGRLSGRLSFGGYVFEPRRTFGNGTLEVERADLADLPVVSHLYGLLSLSPGRQQPTGRGRAVLRLEDYTLIAPRVEFFNRGTDIVASLRVENVLLGGESPISGVAVAKARPLADLGLPFMRDLDDILTGVQAGGASVRIGGTVVDRVIRPAPFEEVGAFMRGLFGASGG